MDDLTIEGTYSLIHRKLPDGTVQLPPKVKGMMTFTREYRNFSVAWQDDAGSFYSECYVARYTLIGQESTETSEYLIIDDQTGERAIRYDLSATTVSSGVSVDGTLIMFALPQPFEKALSITVEFDGAKLKANGKNLFTDYRGKAA